MKKLIVCFIFLLACSYNTESRLTKAINKELASNNNLGTYHLQLTDSAGSIKMEGTAGSEETKFKLEDVIRSTAGVKYINNNMTVDSSLSSPVVDINQELAGAGLQDYKVMISEEAGNVVVSGYAGSPEEAAKIITIAKNTKGVSDVIDRLEIKGPKNDLEVRELLISNLKKDNIDIKSIRIDVSNGTAYLSGNSSNTNEVDRILSVVTMTKGVKDFKTSIMVAGKVYVSDQYISDTLKKTGESNLSD